jgi:tetratricopeptide (TPR) repeat protein
LWIVSAKVQKWLGNQPKSIDRLKKAGSSPIARYLLGRAYFDTGSLTEAKAIFEELIAADPNQYRVALCYGHCLLALGEPTSRAIAPLRLAELYAFRDPEFVGTLGGLLFLNSDYAESADVFRKGTSGSIAVEDRRRITFKPNNPDSRNEPLRLKGRVGAVKPGHIWINVTGLPPIYSSATHINCRPAVRGTLVTFQLAFNADGALGIAVAETPASSS